ncbi:DUF2484 family protein [Rhodobacteraceae bacterium LMO-12]|nr:DUF2484 family protein [Rhodobacteraceae bacterium LMO-JJ12]
MKLSLVAMFLWLLVANLAAMLPSRDNHWRKAYALMALGVPLLVWIFWENPWWVGFLAIAGAMSVMRWPVVYSWRWFRRKLGREG